MENEKLTGSGNGHWSFWEKILFRFFFIYFLLQASPISWIPSGPGIRSLQRAYDAFLDWAVDSADKLLFHIRDRHIPLPINDGAGDTSHSWAELWLFLMTSIIGCIVWSLIDRRHKSYRILGYWLRTFLRYYIATIAFSYGILKLFALQMIAPNLSQMATPLGDFAPMRLCWLFMGYSTPYQVFSGAMEVLAGLLLLYRRTVSLGLLLSAGVFMNVMMLNLCYDIPVKIFSIQVVFCCLFLLAWDYQRLFTFLVLNRPSGPNKLYDPIFSDKRMRVARILIKSAFIVISIVLVFVGDRNRYRSFSFTKPTGPIRQGLYAVNTFALNGVSIPSSATDTLRWKDIIFDKNGMGSVNSTDTIFRRKYGYGRGLFYYEPDTLQQILRIKKSSRDSSFLFQLHYELPDTNTIRCWTILGKDSLYLLLQRTHRNFQLAEKQFHWVSESNR